MREFLRVKNNQKHVTIKGSNADWRELSGNTPWPNAEFHADTSFEINRESCCYSNLKL
jgi:hypothetical protein